MNKVSGNQSDFSLIREDGSRIVLGYDLKKVEGKEDLYEWYEVYLYRKQCSILTFPIVKESIEGDINADTDEKILSGFVWNGVNVWLSAENQRNFSEAQRMAKDYGEAVLPLRFKLGEDAEGNPVYYTFNTIEELNAFYIQAFAYVNQCLNDGWQRKDAIDWELYKALFPEPEPDSVEE